MTQDTINVILILISALSLIVGVVAVILLLKKGSQKPDFSEVYEKNAQQLSSLRQELSLSTQQSVKNMGDMIATNQRDFAQSQMENSKAIEERLKTFSFRTTRTGVQGTWRDAKPCIRCRRFKKGSLKCKDSWYSRRDSAFFDSQRDSVI